ncbi:O-antigen ligase family protein [Aquibacillus albus]|uniref:Tetratricopeptide (TPR) repeat protein n=1 Tax=Aquibacillus albus TaxID=1168171 RepID=A0ABS2MZP8_9BACI|nr:O-antigen ligase family protein [Aquibacillus albus]MBM7571369.1 tetratricopeptide (TPR) repeat protein [Aquibacillus albus]
MSKRVSLYALFAIFSLSYVISPYSKGLFFDRHFIWWALLIFTVTLLWFFISNEIQFNYLFIFIIPLLYAVSLFTAVSVNSTVNELIRWSIYIVSLYIIIDAKRLPYISKILPFVVYITGTWIAIFGILSKWGLVEFQDSFLGSRMTSVIQYPNTFAVIVAAFLLFGIINLLRKDMKFYDLLFYSIPLASFIVAILYSSSRGVFVLFPITWFIGLILVRSLNKKIEYLFISFVTVSCGGLVYLNMLKNGVGEFFGKELLFLLMYSFIVSTFVIIYKKISDKLHINLSKRTQIVTSIGIPISIIVAGILFVLDILNKGLIYSLLPSNLQARLDTIDLEQTSLLARQDFYVTAIQIIKDTPPFGFGADSWNILFTQYQEEPFWATDVHNFYLNQLMNLGWLGGMLFFGVLIYLIVKSAKNIWTNRNNNIVHLKLSSSVAIIMLLLHSAMDFNLSYGTTVFILIGLFGIILEPESNSNKLVIKHNRLIKYALLVPLIIIVTFYTSRIAYANYQFAQINDKETLSEKEEILLKVNSAKPYDPKSYSDLATLYATAYNNSRDEKIKDKIIELITEAAKIEPRNRDISYDLASISEDIGETNLTFLLLEQTIENDPFRGTAYHGRIGMGSELALELSSEGNMDTAKNEASKVIEYYESYMTIRDKFSEKSIPNKRGVNINQESHYFAAQAYIILGQFDKALKALEYVSIDPEKDKEKFLRQQAMTNVALIQANKVKEADEIFNTMHEQYQDFNAYVEGYKKLISTE